MLRFHGVTTRYLGNHLGWRRLIERHDRKIFPAAPCQFPTRLFGYRSGSTRYGHITKYKNQVIDIQ
jgi:hypothetical protein